MEFDLDPPITQQRTKNKEQGTKNGGFEKRFHRCSSVLGKPNEVSESLTLAPLLILMRKKI